ncbi:YqcI/YcgG family protein [Aequorivita sp. F47161]|uniref:YqcI/YcgG family protein n=1 Tax=Aequorivita vitellina TaxID=2874475 RepID=A0A9X1QY95_9FLAO|nr:guanitoxin biosynthesis heme-dependent pre-guanitoxin N-hydroxylase GntA [Aequorivita vitellina]MCG2420480.1 YqcI/YcgG family protein [Aequorivita vitellina]MCZ4319887.1 YqcI/YcgG family protein [Aequorivita viscosa]
METTLPKSDVNSITQDFRNFILEDNHPCIMANTVFQMDKFYLHSYEKLGSKKTAQALREDLKDYISNYDFDSKDFESFIAVFPEEEVINEIEFENLLWRQLQFLHEEDTDVWDSTVSKDPEDPNFSFSIGGKAFYVVGLHPKASRQARQAPYPCMVFNLHLQFEKLREMGVYKKVRDKIRERDAALQGSINPVLEDFGERSEARQYSGRKVGENWKCPFHHK